MSNDLSHLKVNLAEALYAKDLVGYARRVGKKQYLADAGRHTQKDHFGILQFFGDFEECDDIILLLPEDVSSIKVMPIDEFKTGPNGFGPSFVIIINSKTIGSIHYRPRLSLEKSYRAETCEYLNRLMSCLMEAYPKAKWKLYEAESSVQQIQEYFSQISN